MSNREKHDRCPYCGSCNIDKETEGREYWKCNKCGEEWNDQGLVISQKTYNVYKEAEEVKKQIQKRMNEYKQKKYIRE